MSTSTASLEKHQLERAILLEVVTSFVNSRRSTSRHSLVVQFDGQPTGQIIFELVNRGLLNRQTSNVPTDEEQYLPRALAFEFCGNVQFREDAKFATSTVLHTVKQMYKKERIKNQTEGFAYEDLQRYAMDKFPDPRINATTLKLGLYLAKDFRVLTSYRPPDGL